jgi:PLP dependent protein
MTSESTSNSPNMRIDPTRASTLSSNLTSILTRISSSTPSTRTKPVRLVCVSKLKPVTDILALHQPPSPQTPQLSEPPVSTSNFGENYLDELLQKSKLLPGSIKWHFIGQLQSNKAVSLARAVKSLWCVESVDTEKKARLLDRGWKERDKASLGGEEKLRVFVQVNTSGEESKGGVEPEQVTGLCRFVREECKQLHLQGLMTIGAIARSKATGEGVENEDFICLRETRDTVVKELGIDEDLELSMGMSEDFEGAIKAGSDEVRVGSVIFGERPPKAEARILPEGTGTDS